MSGILNDTLIKRINKNKISFSDQKNEFIPAYFHIALNRFNSLKENLTELRIKTAK